MQAYVAKCIFFCKNMNHVHKHYQECQEIMSTSFYDFSSTIHHHMLVMHKNNPSKFYFVHVASYFLFKLGFCCGHEPPCFLFQISKPTPIWFIKIATLYLVCNLLVKYFETFRHKNLKHQHILYYAIRFCFKQKKCDLQYL
jgi:hypothetical protein